MASGETIYLNHAGTSWPKPKAVHRAYREAQERSPEAWEVNLERDHAAVAEHFFTVPDRLLITPGCTAALGVAVSDLPWRSGDVVLMGSFEHHALERAVFGVAARGVEVVLLPPGPNAEMIDLDWLESRLRAGKVRLVALSAAANVTGACAPLDEIQTLAERYGALFLVDAAQLVGWTRIDLKRYDLVAFGAHKGTQGVRGIGALHVRERVRLGRPAGTTSGGPPTWCDVGSASGPALAAWRAGLEALAPLPAARLTRARALIQRLQDGLLRDEGTVRLLGPPEPERRMPTLALELAESASVFARALAAQGMHGSGGEHCAPLAHRTLGTSGKGALRLSVGAANSEAEVERALELFHEVAASRGAQGTTSLSER